MTPIGHSLTGASLAIFAIPRGASWRVAVPVVAACVAAASIPDFSLPGWGHDDILRSHSLWVALVGGTSLAIVLSVARRGVLKSIPKWLPLGLALCWLSHILLDAMYAGTPGLIIGWPFDKRRLALPVWWLHTAHKHGDLLSPHNVRVFLLELATFGPVFATAVGVRWWFGRGRAKPVGGNG